MHDCDIFLDFLNRDSREIFAVQRNFSRTQHLTLLTEALNVAVFRCRDHCIVPPGFLAECEIAQRAIWRRREFLGDRVVLLPMREAGLDDFFAKKAREYGAFASKYRGLWDQKSQRFLERQAQALIPRTTNIGRVIASTWESGPDTHQIWQPVIASTSARDIELIRRIPRDLLEAGIATTWPAIFNRLSPTQIESAGAWRFVLQHTYFRLYIQEFALRVLTGLPFARSSFGLGSQDISYDYTAIRIALHTLGVWHIIRSLSALSMLALRSTHGYFVYKAAFAAVAMHATGASDIAAAFAAFVSAHSTPLRETRLLEGARFRRHAPARGWFLTKEELDALAFRLAAAATAPEYSDNRPQSFARIYTSRPHTFAKGAIMDPFSNRRLPVCVIFVALAMERKILQKRWQLRKGYGELSSSASVHGIEVHVIGSDELGRVAAAVELMKFLNSNALPDLLIVAGIAGGFEQQGVSLGDIIIANPIADLAQRKMRQSEEGVLPEFRPMVFDTDERVATFLKSTDFVQRDWEQRAIDTARWPDGRRPALHYGPIASVDEVVGSTEWVNALCVAWPKLLGVEMEAGGVCAAAKVFDLKVAVVRGVSDKADPAKSDTVWRERAMETVADLLDAILASGRILPSADTAVR